MDYDALARQFGGIAAPTDTPEEDEFDRAARQFGGVAAPEVTPEVTPVVAPEEQDEDEFDRAARQLGGTSLTPIARGETLDPEDPSKVGVTEVLAPTTPAPTAPATPTEDQRGYFRQFGTGFASTVETAKYFPDLVGFYGDAQTLGRVEKNKELYDMIDEGKPISREVLAYYLAQANTNQAVVDAYRRGSPEQRQKMREALDQQVQEARESAQQRLPALAELEAVQQERAPVVEGVTSIRSLADFRDWLGYTTGSVLPQVGLTMAGAALAGVPGALATGFAFNLPFQVESRIDFIMDSVKELPPEEQADAVMEYLDSTADVTMAVAIAQGGLELFGPVGFILRRRLAKQGGAKIAEYATKREAAKAIAKDVLQVQIPQEAVTEGLQETLDIAGERILGEQTEDLFSKENINRLIDASAAGAVGGKVGGAINVSAGVGQQYLKEAAERDLQRQIEQQERAQKIKENEKEIGANFGSLVDQYMKSGMTEQEAFIQAGQDLASGSIDITGLTTEADIDTTTPDATPEVGVPQVPGRFRYALTQGPAYEGVTPLSIDDAVFELEVLQRQAERGRLTPEIFARSEVAARLDTAQIMTINEGIRSDPVATINALIDAVQSPTETTTTTQPATVADIEANRQETAPFRDETAFDNATVKGVDSGSFPIQSSLGNFVVPASMVAPFATRVQEISGKSLDTIAKEGGIGSTAMLEIVTGMEPGALTFAGERAASNILQRMGDVYGRDPRSLESLAPKLREAFSEATTEQGAIDGANRILDAQGVRTKPGTAPTSISVLGDGKTITEPTSAVDGAQPSGVAIDSRNVTESALGEESRPSTLNVKTETDPTVKAAKESITSVADIFAEGIATQVEQIGSLPEAVETQRAALNQELTNLGVTDPSLVQLANQRFNENVEQQAGTETTTPTTPTGETVATVTLDNVTTDTPASNLPTNPATGLKPPGKRRGGRKPLNRTPEEQEAAAQRRKDRQKVGRDAIRTADKAMQTIEKPFDVDAFDSVDDAKAEALRLEAERRNALVDAFRILADKNIGRDTKAKKTAQKVVDHPSVDQRERTIAENISKQQTARSDVLDSSTDSTRDPAYTTFNNAIQALDHIIKTGNAFERLLAKRIKPFLKGVRLVTVLNPNQDIPNPQTREAFRGATGLYVEDADGSRTIYLNDMPGLDGTNNMTFLHEAVHGATMAQINSWIRNPSSVSPEAASALTDMQDLMMRAGTAYSILNAVGKTDPIENRLFELGVFGDLKEFVAYGLTQPEMQDFLGRVSGRYQFKNDSAHKGLLTKFVETIRKMFRMGPQHQSGFQDLLVVTDRLLSAPTMTPGQEAATAAAKKLTAQDKILEKIRRSRPNEDMVNDVGKLTTTSRNPKDALRLLRAAYDAMSSRAVRAALFTLSSRDIVRWMGDRVSNLKNIQLAVDRLAGMKSRLTRELAMQAREWIAYNNRNPAGGKILADLMNATTLIGVDPTLHNSTQDALANDATLVDLRAELDAAINQPTATTRNPRRIRAEITTRENNIRLIYDGGTSPSGYRMGGWTELGKIGKGEGQKLYQKIKKAYERTFDTHQELLLNKIRNSELPGTEEDINTPKGQLIAEITRSFQEAKQMGVYFPLMRFGNFWLRIGQGKNSQYFMFDSEVKRNEYARRRAEEMAIQGETRGYEQLIADQDMAIGNKLDGMRRELVDSSPMLKTIFEALDNGSQVDPATGRARVIDVEAIKDQIYQMYLMTLPERDIRRRFTHRQGRTGFTSDTLRTFIASQQTAANQLSRLAYSDDIRTAIGSSYAELAGNPAAPKLAAAVNELAARAISEISPPATGLSDAFGRVGNQAAFLYMLSSIKSAVVQTTQFPIVVLPSLVAKYGLNNTLATVAPYMNIFNRFGLSKYNDDGELITEWGKPSINDSNYVNTHPDPEYRDGLKRAWHTGDTLDIFMATYTADMNSRSRVPTSERDNPVRMGTRTVHNFLTGAFHHAERITREVAFMSAYELEYNKLRSENVPHNEAVERATRDAKAFTDDSMFDFTKFNKPRVMTANVVFRLATQFRSFSLQMTSYLVRNFYNMLPLIGNREGKKEAATKFFGTIGMTALFSGAVGMPLYSVTMGVVEAIRDAMRPDPEDPDADMYYDATDPSNPFGYRNMDLWFREWFIPTHFGRGSAIANALGLSDEQALLLQRSVKMGVIPSLTDLNIGSSTTLNNLWFPDSPPSDSVRSAYMDILYAAALGPFGSMVEQGMAGIDDFYQGQWVRGAEKMLPAGLRGIAKSYRQATEGERTRDGAVIREEEWFHIGKLMGTAAGFQSTEIAEVQKKNFLARRVIQQIERERTRILTDLDRAAVRFENQPTDENWARVEAVLDTVQGFNYRNGFGSLLITQETIQRSLKERAKRRGMAIEGLSVPKSRMPFVMPLIERTQR